MASSLLQVRHLRRPLAQPQRLQVYRAARPVVHVLVCLQGVAEILVMGEGHAAVLHVDVALVADVPGAVGKVRVPKGPPIPVSLVKAPYRLDYLSRRAAPVGLPGHGLTAHPAPLVSDARIGPGDSSRQDDVVPHKDAQQPRRVVGLHRLATDVTDTAYQTGT